MYVRMFNIADAASTRPQQLKPLRDHNELPLLWCINQENPVPVALRICPLSMESRNAVPWVDVANVGQVIGALW